jgi:alpha-mannosidase
VSALKKSDREDAIVVRVFDERGQSSQTPVHFLGQSRAFRAVNMLEEDLPAGETKVLNLQPYEIGTIKILHQ